MNAAQHTCPACSNYLKQNGFFCGYCGQNLTDLKSEDTPYTQKKYNNLLIIITLFLLVSYTIFSLIDFARLSLDFYFLRSKKIISTVFSFGIISIPLFCAITFSPAYRYKKLLLLAGILLFVFQLLITIADYFGLWVYLFDMP